MRWNCLLLIFRDCFVLVRILKVGVFAGLTAPMKRLSRMPAGEAPQHVVTQGHWFAAWIQGDAAFALLGCTVAPGFDFADFELAERERLASKFPSARALIERLTPEPTRRETLLRS